MLCSVLNITGWRPQAPTSYLASLFSHGQLVVSRVKFYQEIGDMLSLLVFQSASGSHKASQHRAKMVYAYNAALPCWSRYGDDMTLGRTLVTAMTKERVCCFSHAFIYVTYLEYPNFMV